MSAEYEIKKALTVVEIRRAGKRRSSRRAKVDPRKKMRLSNGKNKAREPDMDAGDEGDDEDEDVPEYDREILNKFQV
jgi:hypothetical protein